MPAGPLFSDVTMRMKPSSPHGSPHELRSTQYSSPVVGSTPQPAIGAPSTLPLDGGGAHRRRQQVGLVRHQHQRVLVADHLREVGDERAVEVEDVDDRDDDAALRP